MYIHRAIIRRAWGATKSGGAQVCQTLAALEKNSATYGGPRHILHSNCSGLHLLNLKRVLQQDVFRSVDRTTVI